MADSTPPTFEPLGQSHDRAAFSCAKYPIFENYIKKLARQDARRNLAAPFVMCPPNSSTIIGFYTLSSCSVLLPDLPPDQIKKDRLPMGRVIPATLLGQLAVDDAHAKQGNGELLLMDALQRSLRHSENIASYAVVVDAIDGLAAEFYLHFDFIPMPSIDKRLYLPMGTIKKLF